MVFSYGICITGFYYEIIHCEVGTDYLKIL